MIISLFLIIISIIIFIYSSKNLTLANEIKNTKNKDIAQSQKQLDEIYKKIDEAREQYQKQSSLNNERLTKITTEYHKLSKQSSDLSQQILNKQREINKIYENEKYKINEQVELYKKNTNYASEQYFNNIEKQYEKAEKDYFDKKQNLDNQLKDAEVALEKIKTSLSAATEAHLREQEKENNLQFYKLSLSTLDLEDVTKLNALKLTLHNPVILSKLIWTQYFQKQTTEMCNRILGIQKVCGIYKITNLKTHQCYIGQSVDVAQRFKDHVKCGLGIEASATNKLYNAMQTDGVWNFTFELIEACPREDLDAKEKQWIEMYQSNIYSYNSTKGNK